MVTPKTPAAVFRKVVGNMTAQLDGMIVTGISYVRMGAVMRFYFDYLHDGKPGRHVVYANWMRFTSK